MITIALPIWNNKDILWLALEGLARQQTDAVWELIVSECPGDNQGLNILYGHSERIKKAGCVKIRYIMNRERMALGMKWKQIARKALGEMVLLQASDEFAHPKRIEIASGIKEDWYHCRYSYTYSFSSKKLVMFDKFSLARWLTGYDMAVRTSLLGKIPDNDKRKGVDFFLFSHCGKSVYLDQNIYSGIATNGQNSISLNRERHFIKARPPFKDTDKTIHDLGLPKEIVDKILNISAIPAIDKFKSRYIKARNIKTGKIDKVLPESIDRLIKNNQYEPVEKPTAQPLDIEL